jgi:hypothetical protein
MPPCNPLHPVTCAGDAAGSVAGAVAGSAVDKLVESFAHAVESALKVVTSAWLSVPSPSPTSSTVTTMQQNLEWVTLLVAAVGMLVAIVRMGVTSNLAEGVGLARMYLAMVVVTGCGGVVVASLIQAGDAAAPWFVERAYGADYSSGTATLITAAMLQGTGQAMGLVMGLIALIASLFQIAFMFVRGALLIVLMAMLPTIAAGTATEAGMLRFKRVCAWIFACVIYKPVAAIIYAIGFLQIKGDPAADLNGLDDVARSTYDLVLGTIIIILAVLALPALIRFVAPVADRVGGSSLSPGAALGSVPTGAVVVTRVIATGRASAPAAGPPPVVAPPAAALPRWPPAPPEAQGPAVRQRAPPAEELARPAEPEAWDRLAQPDLRATPEDRVPVGPLLEPRRADPVLLLEHRAPASLKARPARAARPLHAQSTSPVT